MAAAVELAPERREESSRLLVRRYLEGFGPASVADVAQFTFLKRSVARDVLPALLVDGYVAGVWRTVEGGIEAMAFHQLPDEAWAGLAAEAAALRAFLADREPIVYGRYAHWWAKLPQADVRLLR